MGNEQSDDGSRRRNQENSPQMSEAQVKRLLESQRKQYEKKLEEVAAKAAAQRKLEEGNKEAAQRRQEAAARAAAQRNLQAEAAKAAVLNLNQQLSPTQTSAGVFSNGMERDRTPYSYSGNQLQQPVTPLPAPQPLFNNGYPAVYPNLNQGQGPSSPNAHYYMQNNNNQFRPAPASSPNQDFVFVNNYRQTANYNRPAAHKPAPSAPTAPRGPSPRARSVSRNRNSQKERDVLDCPTCYSRYGMKIFQCQNGHSSCDDCKTSGRSCGICKRPITNVRNYDIENHIAQTKVSCPHSSEGCKLFIKVIDMENHVKECPFKEQQCPLTAVFGTCHWKGKLSQISSHFDSVHPNGRETNVDTEMQLTNVRNNSQQVHLVLMGVYNFLLHVKVSETDGKVYMAVQLIGTKFSAMKWLYEIHVFNKSENRRKYMYTDNCCSSSDKIEDVFKAGECAVLPVWHANTFFNNGAMTYKFFIKKVHEEKRGFGKNQRGRGRNHN